MQKILLFATISAMCVSAAAQDLQKEITVDRTVQPELRDAYRINGVIPSLISTQVSKKKLNTAEYTSPGNITNEAADLPPAPWRDSIDVSPYDGYASLGYFPAVNIGANAGYRLYRNDRTNVGAWMQFNNSAYNADKDRDLKMGQSYITIGANDRYKFNKTSDLKLDLEYTHASVRTPWRVIENGYVYDRNYRQKADKFNADINWHGDHENVKLNAAAGFSHFGFGNDMVDIPNGLSGVSQNALDLAFGFGVVPDDSPDPWIGAIVDWTVLKSDGLTKYSGAMMYYDKATLTEGHLRPYLIFGNDDNIRGRFGLNLSIATGNGNGHLRIAPDIEINWSPIYFLTLYGKATGGEYLNCESALFDVNPYMSPLYAYERSNRAIELEAGAVLLTNAGFKMRGFLGCAVGRGRLMPFIEMQPSYNITSTFISENVNSWHAGLAADYAFKRLFTLGASIEIGGSNKDYASWQYWHDGAKIAAEISASARPIDPLNVKIAYQLRTKRKAPGIITFDASSVVLGYGNAQSSTINDPAIFNLYDLGNISSLNIMSDYKINDQLTAFLNVENLLNKKWNLVGGLPQQGIHGLIGVAYKF